MDEQHIADGLKQAYAAESLDADESADITGVLRRAHSETGMRDLITLGFSRLFQAFLVMFSGLYAMGDRPRRSD